MIRLLTQPWVGMAKQTISILNNIKYFFKPWTSGEKVMNKIIRFVNNCVIYSFYYFNPTVVAINAIVDCGLLYTANTELTPQDKIAGLTFSTVAMHVAGVLCNVYQMPRVVDMTIVVLFCIAKASVVSTIWDYATKQEKVQINSDKNTE